MSVVQEHVHKIDGVDNVEVDLASGRVVVTSKAPLPGEAMKDAIGEAGLPAQGLTAASRGWRIRRQRPSRSERA